MTQQWADISGWQAPRPDLAGMLGVMMKSTEGTEGTNQFFAEQKSWIQQEQERGYYHYADGDDPTAEADHFVDFTGRVDGEAQALDVEGNIFNVHGAATPEWCATWLKHVMGRTGNMPGIYLSQAVILSYDWTPVLSLPTVPWLWIAEWNGQNSPTFAKWPVWTLWQYADTNISGGDSDLFNGDLNTFRAIAKNTSDPLPTPNPTPTPTPSPEHWDYIVESGDTMSSIAAKFGVSLADLEAANPQNPNQDLIYPGWIVHVPGPAPAPAPAPNHFDYVVQSGDTMSSIAQMFNVSLAALEAANPQNPNQNLIYPGWIVHVPGNAPAPERVTYVQPGDSLSLIAERLGVSLQYLEEKNPQIQNFDLIFPGEAINY